MNNRILQVSIILAILTTITLEDSPSSMIAYEMKVSLKQFPLPITMPSILKKAKGLQQRNQITKIEIKMGHLTGNNQHYLFPRGTNVYITNQTELEKDYLTKLKSLLQVSQDQRFEIYLQEENLYLISDPNDRFCTEQMEYYLRYFYPCKNFASLGLERLINPSKLFQKYLAFEFKWTAEPEQIHMKVIFPKEKEISQFSRRTNCGQISVYQLHADSGQKYLSSYSKDVQYSGSMIDRWYHPSKCISHTFKLHNKLNNSRIKVITMLPLGFIYDNFTVLPSNFQLQYSFTKKDSSLFVVFEIKLSSEVSNQIQILINFHSSIPPFQTFQTIAGGGEQIMNMAFYFKDEQMLQLHSKIISQHLLEPDFSIPFETITFTVGIVGYLWINLWRIYKFKANKRNKIE